MARASFKDKVLHAVKVPLSPNNKQITYFKKCCGLNRLAWNWALAEWERQYAAGEKPNAMALKKQFNAIKYQEWPFVAEVSQYPIAQAFADLQAAFDRWFRSVKAKDGLFGRPKFKNRRGRKSFYLANTAFRLDGNTIKIQKLDTPVRLIHPIKQWGRPLSARVSESGGRWWFAVQFEVHPGFFQKAQPSRDLVGVDLGSRSLAVLDTGEEIPAPKSYNRNLERIVQLQQRLTQLTQGSNRHQKLKDRLTRLHGVIASTRRNAQHRLTKRLATENRVVAVQRFPVKQMTRSGRGTVEEPGKNVKVRALFNRHLLDAAMGETYRQIEYKTKRYGTVYWPMSIELKASQTCHRCDWVNEAVDADTDRYQCPNCLTQLERKYNHAKNIARWAKDELENPMGTVG